MLSAFARTTDFRAVKGEVEMKKGYSKITEFSDSLRWYELWRGISNAFMAFLEKILIIVGWYHPEESNEG